MLIACAHSVTKIILKLYGFSDKDGYSKIELKLRPQDQFSKYLAEINKKEPFLSIFFFLNSFPFLSIDWLLPQITQPPWKIHLWTRIIRFIINVFRGF